MSDTVISVENVSKIYRLGEVGTGSLAHDVNRWWHRVRGKEDPYLKVGQVNDRTKSSKDTSKEQARPDDWVYALKDINFKVKQGEVLGVIGSNGAGKSTFLKILSRVTSPSAGKIKVKGRVASLLEVGTGFHPELTGKENIFLNGAILGMTRHEILRKLDEIIEFSGCARYIDTPVKRYSSGMYVRLAFSVAAHLESEILIVDEVLAVGDSEFQRQSFGKMRSVAASGRTVILVTHQFGMVAKLATNAILFNKGHLQSEGKPNEIIQTYTSAKKTERNIAFTNSKHIQSAQTKDTLGEHRETFTHTEEITIDFTTFGTSPGAKTRIGISLQDAYENRVFSDQITLQNSSEQKPISHLSYTIPNSLLAPGGYSFMIVIHEPSGTVHEHYEAVCHFKIVDAGSNLAEYGKSNYGCIQSPGKWKAHQP